MANERRRVVHGSYSNEEELIEEIRRLREQGYRKEEIVVYSSGDGVSVDDAVAADTTDDAVTDPMKRAPGSTEGPADTTDAVADRRKRAPGSEEGVGDLTDGVTEPRKRQPGPTGTEGEDRVPDKGQDLVEDAKVDQQRRAPGSTDVDEDADIGDASLDRQKRAPGSTGEEHGGRADSSDADSDDESAWDKIKDFFTADTYDYEEVSSNPNYRTENDVLYPHRQDLKAGNRIIVLDEPNEEETRINI